MLKDNHVISRDWLYQDELVFRIEDVLKDSLYYPASGLSGTMVELFVDKVASFIHVDYLVKKDELHDDLLARPFKGFKMIHSESVDPNLLVPNSWNFGPDSPKLKWPVRIDPYCEWMVFENSDLLRFSLLHICAEGVSAYEDLYNRLGYVPYAVACQRSDGFSMNWTFFLNPDQNGKMPLYEMVKQNWLGLPKYLIAYISHQWDIYDQFVDQIRNLSIYTHK